jgi:hypothetical protein
MINHNSAESVGQDAKLATVHRWKRGWERKLQFLLGQVLTAGAIENGMVVNRIVVPPNPEIRPALSTLTTPAWLISHPENQFLGLEQKIQPENSRSMLFIPPENQSVVVDGILASGGSILAVFPDQGVILADLAAPLAQEISAFHDRLSPGQLQTLDSDRKNIAQIFNHLQDQNHPRQGFQENLEPPPNDALVPPLPENKYLSPSALESTNPAPNVYEQSEVLFGKVAVGILLPESQGDQENWQPEQVATVISEINKALEWWKIKNPEADLNFIPEVHIVPTSVEPISLPSYSQSIWIRETMRSLGLTDSSYFEQVRHYNNSIRDKYKADWSFSMFTVNDFNDVDNRFTNGQFAYAYLGGPFLVMTYGNNGYGPENMDAVAAHEIGHVFYALDQYPSAFQPCDRRSGYFGVENQNSQYGNNCALNVPSIMRGLIYPYTVDAVDPYARGQIGWEKSDAGGMKYLQNPAVIAEIKKDLFRAELIPYLNANPYLRSHTINRITGAEFKVGGNWFPWVKAEPVDGAFDSPVEELKLPIKTGPLPVYICAQKRFLQPQENAAESCAEFRPAADTLIDEIPDTVIAGNGFRISGHSEGRYPIVRINYQIGDVSGKIQNFTRKGKMVSWVIEIPGGIVAPGDHEVGVQAITIGGEEFTPAEGRLRVLRAIYLPIVSRSRADTKPLPPPTETPVPVETPIPTPTSTPVPKPKPTESGENMPPKEINVFLPLITKGREETLPDRQAVSPDPLQFFTLLALFQILNRRVNRGFTAPIYPRQSGDVDEYLPKFPSASLSRDLLQKPLPPIKKPKQRR